jgi:hypothetical protein
MDAMLGVLHEVSGEWVAERLVLDGALAG